jgi:uncharacterized protein
VHVGGPRPTANPLGPQLLVRRSTCRKETSLARTPADQGAGPLQAAVRRERLLSICLAIVALHVAVIALLFPGGASVLLRVAILLGTALGLPVLVMWLVRITRGARALVIGLVGLAATVTGLATSIPHAVLTGLSGGDLTGILATAAGIVLVGFSFREALRGRRLVFKFLFGTLGVYVLAQWLIAPAINVGVITNAPRPASAAAATIGLPGGRDVSFPASDGIRLAGWYVPGRTSAAVILLHGSHGTRSDTLAQMRMLLTAGYGVLAFDGRGHGQSGGPTNALGWSGARDIAGAVNFLRHQPGVNPRRIAALGLSMGAEAALRAAAAGVALSAVVADGAGASTLTDNQLLEHGLAPVFTSVTWLTMRGAELVSGETEPTGLSRLVGHIRVPVLLIASNANGERAIDRIYRDRIGRNASLWYLPDAGHTAGLSTHPRQYAARVDRFLAGALRER